MDWDQYFMSLTYLTSMKSKDTSTKVGAVIVGPDRELRSTGYNSLPRGMNDNILARYERPLKYSYFEHAERNAIYNAARIGVSCKNCVIYTSWCPCVDCARAVIQSGIVEVVVHKENPNNTNERWEESLQISKEMLAECGVTFREWSGSFVNPQIFYNGDVVPNPYNDNTGTNS
jgi:dCMP deaminase